MKSDVETTAHLARLRRDLKAAHVKLEKTRIAREELVSAVREAAAAAVETIEIPEPVPAPRRDKRQGDAEMAVCVLSDWQLGKTTPTYNSAVCRDRIRRYADRVARLTEIQRTDHPVREARVYLLGDIVEGELIFPGQAHLIDASLYRQVVAQGPEIMVELLRNLATVFDKVHVVGVIGNHGSLGGKARRDYHPETNADAMLYEVSNLVLSASGEKRITFADNFYRGERKWYAVDTIGPGASFFLFHGDQVKGGFAGFPWYGFTKKVQGWRMGAVPEPFNYALSGHFHTPVRMLIGNVRLWGNGSTESTNTYAAETLSAQGTPSQWLLFCHPRRGVTAEYEVHLS